MVKTDWKLFMYFFFMITYAIIIGVVGVGIYIEVYHNQYFNWGFNIGVVVCSMMVLYYAYKCKGRIEFNAEKELLQDISEKLREEKVKR